MNIIDTTGKFVNTAAKTKAIKAVMASDFIRADLIPMLLLNTLEGPAPLDAGNFICKGFVGEPWQQTPKKLNSTYDFGGLDEDGWFIYEPKPGATVEMFYATEDGYVQGTWGSTIPGLGEKLQLVQAGDAICRDPNNHIDQWRVLRTLFDATYDVL
jgi:hypothetical protein